MTKRLRIPIGIENYKDFLNGSYYYVDKTLLIKELLDKGGKVTLFTRPRRFGKTLALSMIKTFFEKETDRDGNEQDNGCYFQGKKIMEAGEEYIHHMGKYPVISFSLKSAKQPDFQTAYNCLVEQIAKEFERHSYVLHSDKLLQSNKEIYCSIMSQKAEYSRYVTALAFLSDCLKQYHEQKVVILLDEYDVPLENAYFHQFYGKMIAFIRSLFESALKTNDSLAFAVITGCLRIGKESIFTGLNNLKLISVLNRDYAEYFGFTSAEVRALLTYYGLSGSFKEVKRWYDGYRFGDTEVYNPWSVLNYADETDAFPKPYWSNTSSNSIIREMVEKADTVVKKEVESLIAGDAIIKPVHEEITYEDIYSTQDNLWNFLFFTGYLKMTEVDFKQDMIYLRLAIPNEEIRYIYRYTIKAWFENKVKTTDMLPLYQAVLSANTVQMEDSIKQMLRESIGFFDTEESFYHGFMLGLLKPLQNYEIFSNFASGEGRSDLILKPFDEIQPAVILEFKNVKKFSQMEDGCEAALRQMEEKHYDAELIEDGYETILKYGICFCKKSCKVRMKL
ncbi:MAG: AAA family ATPase [Lachnospiraceae bacterium]|nr:AAA family ATPase [Lachnospiraceae bacterium]